MAARIDGFSSAQKASAPVAERKLTVFVSPGRSGVGEEAPLLCNFAMPPTKRPPRAGLVAQPEKRAKRVEHTSARAAPDQALRELAALLGRTAKDPPTIRKTNETLPRISIIDVMIAVSGKSHHDAAQDFRRLLTQYPEVGTNCSHFRFAGRGHRDTPVTDARGITEVIMLMGVSRLPVYDGRLQNSL